MEQFLSPELYTEVCSYLDPEQLRKMSRTSQTTYQACKNALVSRYIREFFYGDHDVENWINATTDEKVHIDIDRKRRIIDPLMFEIYPSRLNLPLLSSISSYDTIGINLNHVKMEKYPELARYLVDNGFRIKKRY